jgi:hypothetical protein
MILLYLKANMTDVIMHVTHVHIKYIRYSGAWLHLQLGQKHRIPTLLGILDKDIPSNKEHGGRAASDIHKMSNF